MHGDVIHANMLKKFENETDSECEIQLYVAVFRKMAILTSRPGELEMTAFTHCASKHCHNSVVSYYAPLRLWNEFRLMGNRVDGTVGNQFYFKTDLLYKYALARELIIHIPRQCIASNLCHYSKQRCSNSCVSICTQRIANAEILHQRHVMLPSQRPSV